MKEVYKIEGWDLNANLLIAKTETDLIKAIRTCKSVFREKMNEFKKLGINFSNYDLTYNSGNICYSACIKVSEEDQYHYFVRKAN